MHFIIRGAWSRLVLSWVSIVLFSFAGPSAYSSSAAVAATSEPDCAERVRLAVGFLKREGFSSNVRDRDLKRWIRDRTWAQRAEEASALVSWLESRPDEIYEDLAEAMNEALPDLRVGQRPPWRDWLIAPLRTWSQGNRFAPELPSDALQRVRPYLQEVLQSYRDPQSTDRWVDLLAVTLLPHPVNWDDAEERDTYVRSRLERYLDQNLTQASVVAGISAALRELFAGPPIALVPATLERRLRQGLAEGLWTATEREEILRAVKYVVWDPEREPHSPERIRKRIAERVDRQLGALLQEKIDLKLRSMSSEIVGPPRPNSLRKPELERQRTQIPRQPKPEPRSRKTSVFADLPTPSPGEYTYSATTVPEDVASQREILARLAISAHALSQMEKWFFALKAGERRPFLRVMMQLDASTKLRPGQVTGIKPVTSGEHGLWEIKPGKTRIRIYFGIGPGGARLINGSDQAKSSPNTENRLIREAGEIWSAYRREGV